MAANASQIPLGQAAEDHDKETTAKLTARIEYAYSRPNWATFLNVRNAGGFDADRSADALSLGLWPSTGHLLVGFEVKISRADWLRELKDPWKAEAFAKFCDEWWLVAAKADIVKPGELPEGWGLMVPHGHGLKRAQIAKRREKVEPIERGLLAAILTRAGKAETAELNDRYQAGIEHGKKLTEDGGHAERADRLEKVIKDFEAASGVKMSRYGDGERIGAAVKSVLDGTLERHVHSANSIERIADNIKKLCAELRATNPLHPKDSP